MSVITTCMWCFNLAPCSRKLGDDWVCLDCLENTPEWDDDDDLIDPEDYIENYPVVGKYDDYTDWEDRYVS